MNLQNRITFYTLIINACLFTYLIKGCATTAYPPENNPYANIDYHLAPFVNDFLIKAHTYENHKDLKLGNLTVQFGDLYDDEDKTVGQCNYYYPPLSNINRNVIIDKEYWEAATITTRQQLMYHELGHCLLNLGHDSTFLYGDKPTSIMSPIIFADTIFSLLENYYYNELFTKKAPYSFPYNEGALNPQDQHIHCKTIFKEGKLNGYYFSTINERPVKK